MKYDFELGYTPYNLRKVIELSGLSQIQICKLLGKSRTAFERYMHPSDDERHVTMKNKDWLRLIELLKDSYGISLLNTKFDNK